MDFQSLNRRELQSLCKLNKIPANITNIAMADALKSLETVIGIEDIFNRSSSETAASSVESVKKVEILSPRVSNTSCRTTWKKVKKPETESLIATASRASRGVRRQLTGEANEFLKTPSVSGARKKGTATSTLENTVKKEIDVQRVYNTRRSARLTAKKCTESGVTEMDISQLLKIASFLEEACVTSEKSVGSGSSSSYVETSHESNTSSENTKDNVGEGNVENCDEGISKVDCCSEKLVAEEKQKVEMGQLDNISKRISDSCEDVDLEENMLVLDETVDPFETLNVSVKEQDVCLAPEEHFGSLFSDQVLSGQNSEEVDCYAENVGLEKVGERFILNEPDSKGVSCPCEGGDLEENTMVGDEQIDLHEALNFAVKEHDVYMVPEEHSGNLLCDKVLSGQKSEKVDFCGESLDLEETQKVEDKFNLNELETSEEKRNQLDNIKPDLKSISNPCENEDAIEKLMMVEETTMAHETLNVSIKEHNVFMSPEEHTDTMLCDNVLTEADSSNVDFISCDTENPNDLSESVSEINLYEALDVSVKDHTVHLALDEHPDSLLYDKVIPGLAEVVGGNEDFISPVTEDPSDSSGSVLEMKNEVLECNGSSNNRYNPSELPKSDNPNNNNVAMEMTTEVDEVLVNPNGQEPSKGFETHEESPKYLIKESALEVYQQTEETTTHADDVNDYQTQLTPIKNEHLNNNSPTSTREMGQVSDNNENIVRKVQEAIVEDVNKQAKDEKPPTSLNDTSMRQLRKQLKASYKPSITETGQVAVNNENIVEDDKANVEDDNKKAEDEKLSISLNDTSVRQLKKQLKALTIKSNLNTYKDDQVAETIPVLLQAVCDNHLATVEES